MHKNMPATTWQAWVHVFNFFTCLLDRGGSKLPLFYFRFFIIIISIMEYFNVVCYHIYEVKVYLMKGGDSIGYIN